MPLVLIVDDEPRLRDLMARMLSSRGYETMCASNGEEGLGIMRERRPCLVLLDLRMPVLDGWGFRQQQLADPALADVPVVCVTGFSDKADAMRGTGVPCITKPYAFPEILQAVRSACGAPAGTVDRTTGSSEAAPGSGSARETPEGAPQVPGDTSRPAYPEASAETVGTADALPDRRAELSNVVRGAERPA